jgi:hypothetical protein
LFHGHRSAHERRFSQAAQKVTQDVQNAKSSFPESLLSLFSISFTHFFFNSNFNHNLKKNTFAKQPQTSKKEEDGTLYVTLARHLQSETAAPRQPHQQSREAAGR